MISVRNYITAFILIFMVFVMFMFVGVSSGIMSDTSSNIQAMVRSEPGQEELLTADRLNLEGGLPLSSGKQAAIFSGGEGDRTAELLIEWCVYNKYRYKLYTSLPEPYELRNYEVLLFGDFLISVRSCERLNGYAELGVTMIFTQLPDYGEMVLHKELSGFFGIRAGVMEEVLAEGFKVFSGFMINRERIYHKGDFYGEEDDSAVRAPYYSLAAGYEVYSVGLFEKQAMLGVKDEELPPLLWRTRTGKALLFVINCDIYRGSSLLGVLSGFMAQEGDCYVYPIVNAQTISLLNYPYFSKENEEKMQQLYSRSSEAVARDLLWPNIIQILKNYGNSYSFFLSPQLDYRDGIEPTDGFVEFYLQQIRKLPGNLGLSLGQVSNTGLKDMLSEGEIFLDPYMKMEELCAVYTAEFSQEEVKELLDHRLLRNISLIMSEYREGDKLIDYLGEEHLSVKFNMDGYRHETWDDLRMICVENALGMCNQKVDIKRVIFPEDSRDEWNYLSLRWSKGDTYYRDYSKLDRVSVNELEKRVRRFLALDYTYQYDENQVEIKIDPFEEEAFFVLRINSKRIDAVENGTAEKITEDSYLIKALEGRVRIVLMEENELGKPGNGKMVPASPEK